MCDWYEPCACLRRKRPKWRRLTLLLLDCWQREYGRRPYLHFMFKRLEFEERMRRAYHAEKDGAVLVEFVTRRRLCRVQLVGVPLFARQEQLLVGLSEALCKVRCIELRLMQLPPRFFELLEANSERMAVQELCLAQTPLRYQDVVALRWLLLRAPHIHTLDVYNCNVDHTMFAVLADGVHKCPTMRALNCGRLYGSFRLTLETTKIALVVASLVWQNKLVELSLAQCELQAQDMEPLAEYLCDRCSRLRQLNLACNIIGADGAECLLRAIVASNTLHCLDISANGLGMHGGMAVVRYLSACHPLRRLNLGYNDIDADTVNLILTSMKKGLPLQQLQLYGNAFDERSAHILRRLLDARVVPQDTIDISVAVDENPTLYRIVPYR